MATNATGPNGSVTVPIQKSFFDLLSMADVTLHKDVQFVPVQSTQEAMERLAHDTEKFLAVLNEGLKYEVARQERAKSEGWFDEDNKPAAENYSPVNSKVLNGFVNTFAMTLGYNPSLPADKKKEIKQQALDLVKGNEGIIKLMKQQSAAAPAEE